MEADQLTVSHNRFVHTSFANIRSWVTISTKAIAGFSIAASKRERERSGGI